MLTFELYTTAIVDQPLFESTVSYEFLEPKKTGRSKALYEMWKVAIDFVKEK